MGTKREYTNGEVTVVWEAKKCVHSGICVKGLPEVFRPRFRPWVKIDAATSDNIINQVKQCPSGALSYYLNNRVEKPPDPVSTKIEVLKNGPLLIHGTVEVIHKDKMKEIKHRSTAFCRCGYSKNKPYCDGTHSKQDFIG
ncbi:(4Fe-4S)-binding protein [Aestuariivivens sediminis]|uniref:(4Fe-4S)-binding protein n=1 Tax=Aestuariivivens sediminis TaxID=2913557 RepID=UPI001F575659|nr:(4Fe-4S)-binding protein [Aestuariivivens sediminis]